MGRVGQWRGFGLRPVVWSENPKQLICEGESSDAGHTGGPFCSSDEGPVMGLEPTKGKGRPGLFGGQLPSGGRSG